MPHRSTYRTKPRFTSTIMSARHQNSHRKWQKILNNRSRKHITQEPSGNANKYKRVMASFKNNRGGFSMKNFIGGFNKLFR